MSSYKPRGLIQNPFSGLPNWFQEVPDLDLNKAIQENIKTDAYMREENAAEDVSEYFEENPNSTWADSRDEIKDIFGRNAKVEELIKLENADLERDRLESSRANQERSEILAIAKYDPDTASLLWKAKGLPGDPNFNQIGSKEYIRDGKLITKNADGSVTLKTLYETSSKGGSKSKKIYSNKEGETALFTNEEEALRAGYIYKGPPPRDTKEGSSVKSLLEDMRAEKSGAKEPEKKEENKKVSFRGGFTRKSSPKKTDDVKIQVKRKS